MLVHKKRYEAAFYQLPTQIDTLEMQNALRAKLLEKYSEEQLENPTEEQQADIKYEAGETPDSNRDGGVDQIVP
ncbi:MAG: hypothetical protein IJV17_04965 [Prevotella sp.]|nr:hypothetical protein [Prevotella sp.]